MVILNKVMQWEILQYKNVKVHQENKCKTQKEQQNLA